METSPVGLMLAAASRRERSWDQCYSSLSLMIYLELSPVIASFSPMTYRFMLELALSKVVQGCRLTWTPWRPGPADGDFPSTQRNALSCTQAIVMRGLKSEMEYSIAGAPLDAAEVERDRGILMD